MVNFCRIYNWGITSFHLLFSQVIVKKCSSCFFFSSLCILHFMLRDKRSWQEWILRNKCLYTIHKSLFLPVTIS